MLHPPAFESLRNPIMPSGTSTIVSILIFLFIGTAALLVIFQLVFLIRFKHLQRRYSKAILATKAGVWEWFPQSKKFYISSEFFAQFGFGEENVPNNIQDWLAYLKKEDRPDFDEWSAAILTQQINQTTPQSLRFRVDDINGESQWLEMRGSVTRWDSRRRVQCIVGTLEQVNHLVATEKELISARENARRRELILSSLLNNIPDPVWSKDQDGHYLDCNDAFSTFNNLQRDQVKGKTDQELNLDGNGQYYQDRDNQALQRGETLHEHCWGTAADGSGQRLFEVYRVPIEEPSLNFKGVLGIARDITERNSLISELKLFKSFADNSAQGFGMATLNGDMSYLNKKMRDLLCVSDDVPLKDLNYLAFYPSKSQQFLTNTVIPYVKEHGVWEGELQAQSMDGRVFETYETYFILRNDEGDAISFGDIMSDISDQKNVSAQLENAKQAAEQASQAKSNFLANMSHEIRTPLNAIIGYAQLIREDMTLTGVAKTRFQAIEGAGERLLALINDILDIARIESGRMVLHCQKVSLRKEILQVVKLLQGQAQKKGLQLSADLDMPAELLVWIDPVKFHQVLTNLVGNAVKFTATGSVTVTSHYEDDLLELVISDTGPGIDNTQMDSLFTPFVQGEAGQREGGTGLGLALSHTLVKLMGGSLAIQSPPSGGTRVTVMMPISDMTEEVTLEYSAFEAGSHSRLSHPISVLVAEDDDWSRDILVSLLEKAGCQIIEAEDGEIAIERFKKYRPEMVMTDIRMPNKSGRDLLKAIQDLDPDNKIPVIAVTASTMTHELAELKKDGFWQVIAKPYKVEEVYEALVSHMDVRFVPIFDDHKEAALASSLSKTAECQQAVMADQDWQEIYRAAKSGDINKTNEVVQRLSEQLPASQRRDITQALDTFDLELVEQLIVDFHPDVLLSGGDSSQL